MACNNTINIQIEELNECTINIQIEECFSTSGDDCDCDEIIGGTP